MSDWIENLTPEERDRFDEFVDHFRRDAVEKIAGSAAFVSLVPKGRPDIKFATELGMAIMLDKPILAIVPSGVEIPAALRKLSRSVVVADIDTEDGREVVAAGIKTFLDELPNERED